MELSIYRFLSFLSPILFFRPAFSVTPGHTRQGLRCRICKVNVHADCASQLPKCQVKQKLLRRQKSTSEIENRATEVEEESEYNNAPGLNVHFSLSLTPSTINRFSRYIFCFNPIAFGKPLPVVFHPLTYATSRLSMFAPSVKQTGRPRQIVLLF